MASFKKKKNQILLKLKLTMGSLDLPKVPRWCFGLILVIWGSGYLAKASLEHWLITIPHRQAVEAQVSNETKKYQIQINRQISQLIAGVEEIANSPNTVEIVREEKKAASKWQKTARTLQQSDPTTSWLYVTTARLPDAQQIFLLEDDNRESPIPGNFVADLLIDEAWTGTKPDPRAARTDQWRIYIARPVNHEEQVKGVVLVEYPPIIFSRSIGQDAEKLGRISLIQSVEGFDDVVIYAVGTGWKEEYSFTVDTQLKDWKIQFTSSKKLVDTVKPSATLFYLISIPLLLVIIAVTLYLIRKTVVIPERFIVRVIRLNPLERLRRQQAEPSTPALQEEGETETAQRRHAKPARPAWKIDPTTLPQHVFRDYDIRGRANSEITGDFANLLGKILGTMMLQRGEHTMVVCADGRNSSPKLKKALCSGILSTGCDLIDMDEAPTPVMNFALSTLAETSSGVMVTASHNPKEDNGFKIIVHNQPLSSENITGLRTEMINGNFLKARGESQRLNFIPAYIKRVVEDIVPPVKLRIAIDCGNGISSVVAPSLFRDLGCEVVELFTEVDGNFPNHDPDPTVSKNLVSLRDTVRSQKLDLGLAFDGDGDRVVAIAASGRIVWPDELLMIFARDIVARHPGADIIYDVKSTRRLGDLINSCGGRPVMWKTGHAHMRNKVCETGAPLGGEYSGHIFFNDRWYGCDDGMYAAARLLEIISIREQGLDQLISSFPSAYATEEIKIAIDEGRKRTFVHELLTHANFGDAQIITTDGLRLEYRAGWALIRPSNTSAALTLRFEGETKTDLQRIINTFTLQLIEVDADLGEDFETAFAQTGVL